MPWKERYTISDEKSLADDEIRWPHGARCCVGITVDLSIAAGPEGIRAADLKTPEAEFGANQGLAAMLAVLRRYDLKATFAVPAVLARIYAGEVCALVAPARPKSSPRLPAGDRKAGSHCLGKAIRLPAAPSARIRWIS